MLQWPCACMICYICVCPSLVATSVIDSIRSSVDKQLKQAMTCQPALHPATIALRKSGLSNDMLLTCYSLTYHKLVNMQRITHVSE